MLLAAMVLLPASLHAQQTTQSELERSRQRLEQIKQQRDSLERQSQRMAGQITDVSVRMRNVERQRDLTSQAVHAIEQNPRQRTGEARNGVGNDGEAKL